MSKKYTRWALESKLEKIVSSNCHEEEWEGTEVNQSEIVRDFMELFEKLVPDYFPKNDEEYDD